MNTPAEPRQAIALKYDGKQAPTLTAKGDDELAEAILAIAREYEVPIYENAELVRLLARLELGDAIPQALYRCIAEIIAFAWYLQGKKKLGYVCVSCCQAVQSFAAEAAPTVFWAGAGG